MVDLIGLLFEVLFFAIGAYIYLYARGFVPLPGKGSPERSEAFRKRNQLWMRLAGLALMAFSLFNIIFHVRDLISP